MKFFIGFKDGKASALPIFPLYVMLRLGMESGLSPVRKCPFFLRKLKSGLLGPKSGPKRTLKMDLEVQY